MKKFIKFFTLVLTICFAVTLSVSANVVDTEGTISDTKVYIAGMPLDISYTTYSAHEDTTYNGIAFDVTKYYYSPAHTPTWVEGTSSTDLLQWSHDTLGSSVYVDFPQDAKITSFDTEQPIFASSMNELNEWYNVRISVYDPHANTQAGIVPQNAVLVRHYFTVLTVDSVDGEYRYRAHPFYYDVQYTRGTDNYVEFSLFPESIFADASFWEEYASFGDGETEYVYFLNARASITSPNVVASDDVWSRRIICTPLSPADNQIFTTWNAHNLANDAMILDFDSINVEFNNVDFVTWIKNAVGSFMDFELVPGISIAGIVSIVIGIPLLIWFLRLFAGG